MIATHKSLNDFSQYYFQMMQEIRAGRLSPVRGLRLLMKHTQFLAHYQFPDKEDHWQRAEMKKTLRELMWTLMEVDTDIWTVTECYWAEKQRVQDREDHHHCLRKAGVSVARSSL